MTGKLRLLEISPGGCGRVEHDKNKKPEQIWRATNVRDTRPKTSSDRCFFRPLLYCRGRRCRSWEAVSFPYSAEIGGEKAHALRGDFKHSRPEQKKNLGPKWFCPIGRATPP